MPRVQKQSTSPTPVKVVSAETFNFPTAIQKIIEGERVTKREWGNPEIYGFLNGEYLSLHKADGRNYQWIIRDGDLLGEDWYMV